jgi:hypothetical protein
MSNDKQNGIVIDFIDPLFAVVLHISFVEMMPTPWFSDFRLVFRDPYSFQLMTLGLAYFVIVSSWVGYHQSIKKNPIDVEKGWGQCRFGLDIVLLIAYFVLVVSYENFRRELWILVVVFLVFVLWDQSKRKEVPETSEDSSARRGVTVLWFLVFLALALLAGLHPGAAYHDCRDRFILVGAILATGFYRWHKGRLGWKPLLLILGYPKAPKAHA